MLHHRGGMRVDVLSPVDQPGWRPLEMRPVGRRSMLRMGAVAVFDEAAHVAGDALAFVEELYGVLGGTTPQGLTGEQVRHAVEVIVVADVIVDVSTDLFPLGILVGLGGQGLQGRSVEPLVHLTPRLLDVAHDPIIEFGEQLSNSCVQFVQVVKSAMTQDGQDPALCHEHGRFHFSFVLGLSDPCWDDAGAVVRGELSVGGVEFSLIPIRMLHTGAKVVADDQSGDATEELKQAHVAIEPDRQLLCQRGDCERVGARTQRSHKQLR